MTLLNEMGDLLQCSATSAEAMNVFGKLRKGSFFLRFLRASTLVFKSSRNLLEEVLAGGPADVSDPTFAPDACWGLRRDTILERISRRVVICSHLKNPVPASYLCVPLRSRRHLGCAAYSIRRDKGDTERKILNLTGIQQRLALLLVARCALASQLVLRETLRDQSIRTSTDCSTPVHGGHSWPELQRASAGVYLSLSSSSISITSSDSRIQGHDAGDTCCAHGGSLATLP